MLNQLYNEVEAFKLQCPKTIFSKTTKMTKSLASKEHSKIYSCISSILRTNEYLRVHSHILKLNYT